MQDFIVRPSNFSTFLSIYNPPFSLFTSTFTTLTHTSASMSSSPNLPTPSSPSPTSNSCIYEGSAVTIMTLRLSLSSCLAYFILHVYLLRHDLFNVPRLFLLTPAPLLLASYFASTLLQRIILNLQLTLVQFLHLVHLP